MKLVGKCSILRMKPKKDIEYPLIRLPKEYREIIGKEALIYEIDKNKFLISVDKKLNIELYNWLYNQLDFSKIDKNLLERAKELEIDINSLLERVLREFLKGIEKSQGPDSNRGQGICSPPHGPSATLACV